MSFLGLKAPAPAVGANDFTNAIAGGMNFGSPSSTSLVPPDLGQAFDSVLGAPSPGGISLDTNVFQALAPQVEPLSQGSGKRSVIDIIGRVADGLATAGGAPAQYQATLDAATQRDRAAQDFEWQNRFRQQKMEAGQNELEDAVTARFGQAARGLGAVYERYGDAGVEKAFPALAQQLGLSDEEAGIMGQSLKTDPRGTIEMLNAATGGNAAQGSKPKEIAVYEMLQRIDPAQAAAYAERIATGDPGMTEYQRAQISLGRDRISSGERTARARIGVQREAVQARANPAAKSGEKSAESAGANASSFNSVISSMRTNYENLAKDGSIVRQGGAPLPNVVARLRASGPGQLVEGAVGTNAQTWRDNITNSRPALVQAIKQATGMSSKQLDSNADMKLALMQATDPTQSLETNEAALRRLEEMVAAQKPAAPAAPRKTLSPRPAARKPAGRKTGPSVSNW